MNEDILYKLWLNILCGHNPSSVNKIIENLGSAEEIYNSDENIKRQRKVFLLRIVLRQDVRWIKQETFMSVAKKKE